MLGIESNQVRLCDGVGRRDFLRLGGLGAMGLQASSLLQARETQAAPNGPGGKLYGKAKKCILLHLWGAPPHQDTFDMKPNAPAEVRGEFMPIASQVPGIQVSDHLPLISRHTDKFTIVRSVHHKEGDHQAAAHDMLTGNRYLWLDPLNSAKRSDYPNIGAVLAKMKPADKGLPQYVQLPCLLQTNSGKIVPGQNAGYLGKTYDPFLISALSNYAPLHDPGFRTFVPDSIRPYPQMTPVRWRGRQRLRQALDQRLAAADRNREVQAFDSYSQRAFDMISSPRSRKAFNLNEENEKTRRRYGYHPFGQSVLMARRLAEAGVPLVTVYWRNGRKRTDIGWDNHINNFVNLKNWQLPPTDQAFSALMEDMSASGQLEDTLVVLMGEFGRTPGISDQGGRQHWPQCYSVVLAGGGIRGGEVFGSSDAKAAYPATNPVTPFDLGATIYHLLGINSETTVHDFLGRPHRICSGTPISGLLG